jgi:hypothetical protein
MLGREDFHEAVAETMQGVFAENLSDVDMLEALAELPEGGELRAEVADMLDLEIARLIQASQTTKDGP